MKQFFVMLNVVLGIFLAGMTVFNLSDSGKTKEELSVKKATAKNPDKKNEIDFSIRTPQEDRRLTIVNNNLFDLNRNPDSLFGGRNSRLQLTLVGVLDSGEHKGAIILQKSSQRNRGRFMMPGMMPPDNSQQTQQVQQQYVRLGETLPNGYTLTEVTRTGVILYKNASRMALQLQEASKNIAQNSGNSNRKPSTREQLQQIQQMQMFQNMQMMRMMRNQNNSGGGNRGGGNRGGGPMPFNRGR